MGSWAGTKAVPLVQHGERKPKILNLVELLEEDILFGSDQEKQEYHGDDPLSEVFVEQGN